jgi:hypothetical protein
VRIAALLCGLMAGLFVLLAPLVLGIDLFSPFMKFWNSTRLPTSFGSAVWYAIPAAAILGGLLTLVIAGLGTFILTVAGLAWLGLSLADAELMRYEILAPSGVTLLGAILAFVGGELSLRRRRMARRADQKFAANWTAEDEDEDGQEAREAALKLAPHMVRTSVGRGTPLQEIPLTLDDLAPSAVSAPRHSAPPAETAFEPTINVRTGPDLTRKTALSPGPVLPDRDMAEREQRTVPDRPRSGSGPVFWLLAVNSIALLAIAVAVGSLLVREYPGIMPFFAATEVAASAAKTDTPGQPANASQRPVAALASGPMSTPEDYCGAVKNIDFVDSRYRGPSFTPEIAATLKVPADTTPDKVRWRCVDGAVYACSAFGWPACDITPTVLQMQEFCSRNADVKRLVAPHGVWACEGGIPRIPEGANWPVDGRGFYPKAWVRVVPANLRSDG